MRQRLLTLPVMAALIVSLVWRRLPSVAEGQRVWAREGLLGMAPRQVSAPAILKRLAVLPVAVRGQLFVAGCARLQAQAPPAVPHPRWAPRRAHFSPIALVDGSTLEALRNKTEVWRERAGLVLGGTMMGRVEAFSHRPLWPLETEDAAAHDKRCAAAILAALPPGGLLVFALGCFSFLWCADFTTSPRFFGTRLRQKTAWRTVPALGSGPYSRDESIPMGQDRANPCRSPVRLVSVLWDGVWYR